jgi:hypothetical protein
MCVHSVILLAAAATAAPMAKVGTGVPVISPVFTADVVESSSGTAPGVPKGTKTFREFYDYTHKRRRTDYAAEGFTKIYRYDQNIEPPVPPVPGNPTFASPKGYKINLHGGQPDPNQCCWLWLVDEDGNPNTMFEQDVAKKAMLVGNETKNGVPTEHWAFKGRFPFPQDNDWWFTPNGSLVQTNSYASIFKQGTVVGNASYTNYVTTPIADVTFTVPTSDPTFGVCKQCGKDPACAMDYCTS